MSKVKCYTINMRFVSTNRDLPNGHRKAATFREALFAGLAPDQGLFTPESVPEIAPAELDGLKGKPFAETAALVLGKFLGGELGTEAVREMAEDGYRFELPLESAGERTWLLRLDRGPTASFKDIAALFLARAMARLKDGGPLTVLAATSGDTGPAVAEAFAGSDGVRVVILYPEGGVSPLQKRQLHARGGNVSACAVRGTFDDCQHLAKAAFADPELAALGLASANSITIGRVLPQIASYVHAHAQAADADEPVIFSVPSGNFGNALAGELARRMGVPVKRLVIATNQNDAFPVFLRTGVYRKVSPPRECLSSAMNVGHPSNLARLFDLYGGILDRLGRVHRMPDLREMRLRLHGVSVSDERTRGVMRNVYNVHERLLEPHGAVGWAGLESYRLERRDRGKAIVLSTAHPAKFREIVRETVGVEPEMPEALRGLPEPAADPVVLPAELGALKAVLLRSRMPHAETDKAVA